MRALLYTSTPQRLKATDQSIGEAAVLFMVFKTRAIVDHVGHSQQPQLLSPISLFNMDNFTNSQSKNWLIAQVLMATKGAMEAGTMLHFNLVEITA
jgi:predicted HTH transcriptional regulator